MFPEGIRMSFLQELSIKKGLVMLLQWTFVAKGLLKKGFEGIVLLVLIRARCNYT
jgi:hypothetical protein